MRIHYGNGGWVLVEDETLPSRVYVRLRRNDFGQWRATEVYLDGRDEAVTAEALQRIPLSRIEAGVEHDVLQARADLPGPDLSRLASHFSATFGRQAAHWVRDSMQAQLKGSGVRQAPMGKPPSVALGSGNEDPVIEPPAGRAITGDFLRRVAAAYRLAARRGLNPAPAIAQWAGGTVSVHAARKWVRLARERGYLEPGQQGRVG